MITAGVLLTGMAIGACIALVAMELIIRHRIKKGGER